MRQLKKYMIYENFKKFVNVMIHERFEGLFRIFKKIFKIKGQYIQTEFNPYNKLKFLKPLEVLIIDKDYLDILDNKKNIFKFSMVIPIKNEEKDIVELLKTIEAQVLQPDEIIIVDGGSKDRTIELIERFKNLSHLPIILIKILSKSISEQRNIGIRSAKNEFIILTDTVVLPTNFCLNLIGPLVDYPDIDFVGGLVYTNNNNYWAHKFIWDFSNVDFTEFIPAGTSLLIKKQLALGFGGFPEFLKYTGEDTLFDANYRKYSKKWAINKKAFVYWDAPDSKDKAVKKAYLYGKGDGENGTGEFRFYDFLINVLKHNKVNLSDPIFENSLKGYLDGRNNRIKILIDNKKIRGNILMLSGVPFTDSGGGQRGTQLALELMKHEHKVTFCNYYPSYEKGNKVFLDIEYQYLELYSFQDFQFQDYIERHKTILDKTTVILELPHPDFIPLIEKLKSAESGISVVYDCIDNWDSTLGGNWYSKEKELEIIGFSNVLMASAKTLVDRLRTLTDKDVHLIPNAVNTRLFDPSIEYTRPNDLPSGRPIAIYTGALWGEWFDWELLKHLANNIKNFNFVMIGNIPEENAEYKELKEYKNIFFLGLKNQFELPGYLFYANVCIIPFKFDEKIIKYTNPLKVYEYLSMRKPVVSTYMNELVGMPYVCLSKDYDGFVENLKNAISMNLIDGDVNTFIYDNSWINRVDELIRLISNILKCEN